MSRLHRAFIEIDEIINSKTIVLYNEPIQCAEGLSVYEEKTMITKKPRYIVQVQNEDLAYGLQKRVSFIQEKYNLKNSKTNKAALLKTKIVYGEDGDQIKLTKTSASVSKWFNVDEVLSKLSSSEEKLESIENSYEDSGKKIPEKIKAELNNVRVIKPAIEEFLMNHQNVRNVHYLVDSGTCNRVSYYDAKALHRKSTNLCDLFVIIAAGKLDFIQSPMRKQRSDARQELRIVGNYYVRKSDL